MDWLSVLTGAAVVAAVAVLVWLVYHLVRLTIKLVISVGQLIRVSFHEMGRMAVDAFSGSWQPSFHRPRLSNGAPILISVAPPTHLIYLTILIAGLFAAAITLLDSVPRYLGSPSEPVMPLFLALPMIAFCAATCVHQYLIYRDLTSAEQRDSGFAKLYATWWIGTAGEYFLRVLLLICLLISSGELSHVLSRVPRVGAILERNPALVVASANVAMFCTFLLWNACALRRARSSLKSQEYEVIKGRIIPSAVAEVLAVILWSSVILLIARPEAAQLAAAAITTTGALYAASVVWRYGPATAKQLLVAASLLVLVSILLGFSAWSSLERRAAAIVAEVTSGATQIHGDPKQAAVEPTK